MKVLIVINRLETGGAEKLVIDTLPLLNNQCSCDLYLLSKSDFPFEKELKKEMAENILSTKWKSIYNPLHIFTLMSYMRKYDIIHVHLFPSQYFVFIAKLLSFSKTKIIVTEHNTTNNRLGNKIFRLLDRKTYAFFDKTICISKEIQDIMYAYTGLSNDKFPIIENGISLDKIKKAIPLCKKDIENINEKDVVILQVSGFRTQKDQKTLIKSLIYLPENVKVCFAGTGITMQACMELARELNVEKKVVFLGIRTDIPQLLKTADIIVLSSHYEGLSLSSIEGMASGKPFIASNVPGLKAVVQGAGLLFEDNNEKQLADHIRHLINDEKFYSEVASKCVERANQYDIKKMVEKQVALYETLFQGK